MASLGSARLQRMSTSSYHAATSSQPPFPGKGHKRPALLYSSGRSISITATHLDPTYPWDYEFDGDDLDDAVLDAEEDYLDDLAGEPYIMNGEDDDYQHPSLETSKPQQTRLLHPGASS
jgi:hypothetical protein